jgi:hypothetical protein
VRTIADTLLEKKISWKYSGGFWPAWISSLPFRVVSQGVGLKSLRICSFLARRNSLKTPAR